MRFKHLAKCRTSPHKRLNHSEIVHGVEVEKLWSGGLDCAIFGGGWEVG